MIVYKELLQNGEEWEKLRSGRATASEAKKVITPTGRVSSSREGYMWQVATKSVCYDPNGFTGNKFTDWGNEYEPEAREVFTEETGLPIDVYGFGLRRDGVIGFSPDGMRLHNPCQDRAWYEAHSDDYGLEIKCVSLDNYTLTMKEGKLPNEHKIQVHWSMAASGIRTWYFMCYFPDLVPFIKKVEWDSFTDKVKDAQDDFVIDFAKEKERCLNKILPSRQKALPEPKRALPEPQMMEDLI
ncbi:MAG: YqaJ viral recombinase family protein [Verrucomicrobiales bacterium]|nr:YqaJ viral recombinase family protein [Verrucomicrobiales bacterium]